MTWHASAPGLESPGPCLEHIVVVLLIIHGDSDVQVTRDVDRHFVESHFSRHSPVPHQRVEAALFSHGTQGTQQCCDNTVRQKRSVWLPLSMPGGCTKRLLAVKRSQTKGLQGFAVLTEFSSICSPRACATSLQTQPPLLELSLVVPSRAAEGPSTRTQVTQAHVIKTQRRKWCGSGTQRRLAQSH